MEDVTVKEGASVYTSILDSDVVVEPGAVVGIENAGKDNIRVVAKATVIQPNDSEGGI
jgi:ADP-glucose pyrophosphorylase